MEQEKVLSSQEKVELILEEIQKNLAYFGPADVDEDEYTKKFRGKIGPDITFMGEVSDRGDKNRGDIHMLNKGVRLAQIRTENGFIREPYAGFVGYFGQWHDGRGVVDQDTLVRFDVCAPEQRIDLPTEACNLSENLCVRHPFNESVTAAIDRVYDAITLSKAKDQIADKLRTLNLPNLKLREATERIVNLLYGENEQNQLKDAGRER